MGYSEVWLATNEKEFLRRTEMLEQAVKKCVEAAEASHEEVRLLMERLYGPEDRER